MDSHSYYQDAFHLYMNAMGEKNKQMFLPDSPENRATRTKFLNGCRMAWKNSLESLPKEFRGELEEIKFCSANDKEFLYVYADKKQPKFTLLSRKGDKGDEFDSFL